MTNAARNAGVVGRILVASAQRDWQAGGPGASGTAAMRSAVQNAKIGHTNPGYRPHTNLHFLWMDSLRRLAAVLDIPERTLRRAADEGLVHGERTSPRRFRTTLREEDYLRRYWPLLRELRGALRTEPSVRLAVLFGSVARGEAHARSDIDLLVDMVGDVARVADVSGRLSRRMGRTVELVRLVDARRSPLLMAAALEYGRVLVDRERVWPTLQREAARWRRRAQREEFALEDVSLDLPRGPVS